MLLAACQTSQVHSARSLGHLIGMLLQLCIFAFGLKDTTHTHAWAHTSSRHAAQPSIQVFMPSRLYGGRNTPVAQTQRTRKYIATRTHGNAQYI